MSRERSVSGQRTRRIACGAVALLFLLLVSPNIAWLWSATYRDGIMLGSVTLAVLLTVGWFALFGRRIWLACLLMFPLALAVPLELYYISRYHVPTSVAVLGTLVGTSPAETHQYLGTNLLPLAAACIGSAGIALAALWFSWRSRLVWEGEVRKGLAGFTSIILLSGIVSLCGMVKPSLTGGEDFDTQPAGHYGLTAVVKNGGVALGHALDVGYPMGVTIRVTRFLGYRHAMRSQTAKLASFRFGAKLVTPETRRQIYVLVIGESSRRDHWQLFGYDRPTNPRLAPEKNLVPVRNMVSAYTQTMLALPVMLTRKPATKATGAMWPEPSIVQLMNEAGFDTWWISNQFAIGPYDSVVAIYANEAKHLEWLNHATWTARGNVDGSLVAPLRQALQASTGNVFVVLHMLGSHLVYDYRYPPAFTRFTPTLSNRDSEVPFWKRATNSYDNTIVYTDDVLAQIIGVLKGSGAVTALWYASDHGETLPSPTCDEIDHGHENKPEYEIPALFWYSDAYAATFPQRVATLRANAGQRTMSENVFPSLVDMAGVDFPGHAKREGWSLFSPQWEFHTRWVNQFYPVDYDHATVEPGCMRLAPAKP